MTEQINWQEKMDAMLRARNERIGKTFPVRLPDFSKDLGEDVFVQVRKFEVGEQAAYFGAPESMSQMIAERTADYMEIMAGIGIQMNRDGSVDESELAPHMVRLMQDPKYVAMVDAVCLASAVEPRLVATPEEVESTPGSWLLSNLTYGDRQAIFGRAQGVDPEGGESASLSQFRQESASDVEDPATEQDAKTSKRSARTKGRGVVGESAA